MEKNKYYYILSMACLFIFALIFILIAQYLEQGFWKTAFTQGASALLISGVLGLINKYFLSNNLVELILNKIKLKADIERTGIEAVYLNIGEINYTHLIRKCKNNIDILHVYGRTWTNNNLDAIKEKILHSNCKIRVILLYPDSAFVPALAEQYNTTPEELKQKMDEVLTTWKELYCQNKQRNKKHQNNIKCYYHTGQPSNSLYRIDDRIIFVQNKFTKGRTLQLPSIVCIDNSKEKDLFGIYLDEINELIKESIEVNLDE